MGLRCNSLLLLAACTILSCSLTESRGVDISKASPGIDIDSLLQNPSVQRGVLNLILQTQGSSADQIHDRIIAADGNLEEAVEGINSELKANVLVVDGDLVKIDPTNVKALLQSAIQTSIRSSLSQNPTLASSLETAVSNHLEAQSSTLDEAIGGHGIPVNVALQALDPANLPPRRKRGIDIQPRDFDLGSIVTGVVGGVLQGQLGALISQVLDTVKNFLAGLYIVVAPADPISSFIATITNAIIQQILQLITSIQENLTGILGQLTGGSRKRRDVVAHSGEVSGENDFNLFQVLGELVGPIFAAISSIIAPVVNLVQSFGGGILGLIVPLLGAIIIKNIIVYIIGLIFPS